MQRSSKNAPHLCRVAFPCLAALLSLAALAVVPCTALAAQGEATRYREVALVPADRILVLAPHPDDETIGCAGVIQKAVAARLPLEVVYFTNGDANEWSFLRYRKHPVFFRSAAVAMGRVRQREAVAAASILGVPSDRLVFLGYPDYGTARIWLSHWNGARPYESILTRTRAVPYINAFHFGAQYKGEEIVADLTSLIRGFRPTKIFVSHPADKNGDHRALYLFARLALWNLEKEIRPEVYAYLVHYGRWPKAKGYHPDEPLSPPEALAGRARWQREPLSPGEENAKKLALAAHRSQYGYSASFLLSFVRTDELFSDVDEVRLPGLTGSAALSEDDGPESADEPDQLTAEEREAFVGLERHSAALEDGRLVLTVGLSRPLARGAGASVYLFGWRPDRPFGDMPKLHLKAAASSYAVYDQDTRLPADTFDVKMESREIRIAVPLAALGEPTKVLTNAMTYLGEVPLDSGSWTALDLE